MVDSFTEKKYFSDLIVSELDNFASRKAVTIVSSAALLAFTILGQITVGAVSQAHTGTGNGAMTALAAKNKTLVGDYIVECIVATDAYNAGTFKVVDPTGNRLDDATVGVAYSNDHLAFSIADGGTDHAVGSKFTLTVAAGSLKWKRAAMTAVDGSQRAAGILLKATDASGGDVADTLVLVKAAQVDISQLVYDATADLDAEKLLLRNQLEALGITFLNAA